MIAADHKIDAAELNLASEIGSQLFENFSDVEFRNAVANHRKLPEACELASVLSGVLTNDDKVRIFQYLSVIASADGAVAPQEQELLDTVADRMKVALPPSPRMQSAA